MHVSSFVYVYYAPPKCCPNKLFEHGKMSWMASLETNMLNLLFPKY